MSLSKEFIIKKLQEINFPQINSEDFNDYASLILALEDNHFSRYQFKKELMEVFSKEGDNEEEDKKSSFQITETKIDTLLQEIYKYKLHLKNENRVQVDKNQIQKQQQLQPSTQKLAEKLISKNESERNRIFQFKRASEQAAASTQLTQEQRKSSHSFSKQVQIKSAERKQPQEKQDFVVAEEKQGILSRIKKHTDKLPQERVVKKVKKDEIVQNIPEQKQTVQKIQPNLQAQSVVVPQSTQLQPAPGMEAQLQQIQQMNQIYQMMLSTMQSQTKANTKQKMKCKYWPNCKEGEKCQYHHPTEKCKKFPNCPFGSQCLYIHPEIPCKFGIHCKRPNCAYSHKPKLFKNNAKINDPKQPPNQAQQNKEDPKPEIEQINQQQ